MDTIYNATTAAATTAKEAIWGKPEDESGKEPVAGGEGKASTKSQPYDPGNALGTPVADTPGPGRTEFFTPTGHATDAAPSGTSAAKTSPVSDSAAPEPASQQEGGIIGTLGGLVGAGSSTTTGEKDPDTGAKDQIGSDGAATTAPAERAKDDAAVDTATSDAKIPEHPATAEEKVSQVTSLPALEGEGGRDLDAATPGKGPADAGKSAVPGGAAAGATKAESRDEPPLESPGKKGLREKLKEKLHISKRDKS